MGAGNPSNEVGNIATPGDSKQIGSGEAGGFDRAGPVESYEKELNIALRWAQVVASLHAMSRFLSFCNLIWASVVVLGAFSSKLLLLDFTFVVCLLLLEAIRLASVTAITGLPMRPMCALAHLSQDPKRIIHSKDAPGWPAPHHVRMCLQALQFILIVLPSSVIPSIRLFTLPLSYNPEIIRNLQSTLHIFYSFIALNSLITLMNLVCSAVAFNILSLNKPPEQSILRYYDRVLENAMSLGIIQAGDFEFFDFAYTMFASEYRRNVQPEAVAKSYKKLIQYLYAHRLGMDFLQIHLDAEDAFVQLAAVNMVGFWADTVWGVGLKEVKLPEELLMELAVKVGTGQVGWAATSTFGVLAQRPGGASLVARTRTSSGACLPERLAELVDATSSRSLSLVRTLVSLYEAQLSAEDETEVPAKALGKAERSALVEKLKTLARGAKVQRLRVQAAYLLLLLGEECDPSVIMAIDPTQDAYWFQSEVRLLHLLRSHVPGYAPPLQLQHLSIRNDANTVFEENL